MRVESRQVVFVRIMVSALVVLVFVLALRAKLSLYDPPHRAAINPAAASKLWVSGEKLKTAVLWLFSLPWLAALFLFPTQSRRVFPVQPVRRRARPFALSELYRFLRPPPAY